MDKSQKCNTTTESQEWLVITRERNQEAWVETDEANEMSLIEEATAEAERDIAKGTDLLAGTETETEDAWNKNVIHPYLQVPTVKHT